MYMLWGGLKFDVSALIYINAIYILLHLIPFPFRYNEGFQKFCKWLFIITNSLGIIANLIDFVYYKFTLKRTTATVFGQFSNEQNKFKLFVDFLKDYWYLLVLLAVFIWVFQQTLSIGKG
jgi:hypothetical protein